MTLANLSLILGITATIVALLGTIIKLIKKLDKIDDISIKLDEVNKRNNKTMETMTQFKQDVTLDMNEMKNSLDNLNVKINFNTNLTKVDTEIVEALADHAIKTQNANGKVHRSLETLEKLKYNNPDFN